MIAEFQNVTKIYDKIIVGVSEVSLDIPKGITGFLGPNGSGKTTCIKLMTGELYPSVGKVQVLNQNPWNNPYLQKEIAYISEINTQFDFLSPIQLLTYQARLAGLGRKQAKKTAEQALQTVGMTEFKKRKLTALSKGMKQRTKIASALLFPRSFILADEPLSGLDPFGRNLVLKLFKQLANDGTSILISSHILFEVEKFTDELILIYNGAIVATGKTIAIRQKLSDFPYMFKIQTSNHAELGSLLLAEEGLVKSLEIIPKNSNGSHLEELLVTTTKPASLQDFIMQIGSSDSNLSIFEFKNVEEDVQTETIFKYLID
ncbi:MAG: ABC transporter ATP-binding protein [Candidatus Hodarchaeales archaeon]